MKKTKKLLSFFLAIMMVITTIPAFTITSNAADFNGTLTNTGAYIIYNSIGNATRKDRYETGSLNICNDGGSNNFCSGWWGFSISSIPSSIDTITAEISITVPNSHTGNTGVSVYATNNSITADTSVSGSGATARDNALAKFPDKKLLGTYTSTSAGTFSADIGDAIKQAKQDGWANFNIFAIQSGVGNGNDSNNNWSDVWFKVPVITVNAVEATISDAELKDLMTTYESRMSDSKLYNNMGAAYNAYVAASKAYDSYHYGLKTDINLQSYYNNLQNALYSMTEYTMSITQKTPGGFNGDSTSHSYTLGNTHQNVLYSPKVNFTDGTDEYVNSDTRSGAKSEIRIAYPTTVLFYDGVKTPKFPIHAYIKRIDNGIIYVRNIYPALETATVGNYTNTYITRSSNFQFEQTWKGQSTTDNYNRDFLTPWFNTSGVKSIEVTGIAGNSLVTGYSKDFWSGAWIPKWARAANVLSYKGIPNEAMNVYSLKWYKCSNDADNTTNLYSTVFEPSASKVYVLNYNGIKTLLTNKKALVNDISYFKENRNSTVSNLLSSFDNLAVDFNGLNYSSPDTVRSDLNSKYNTLNGRTATADNLAGYPAIRAAMDRSMAIFDGNNSDGKYTTSSFAAFKSAYTTAKNVMSSVATAGYIDDSFTNPTTVAADLNTAIDHLVKRADFKNYNTAASLATTSIASYTNKDVALLPYSVMNNYSGVVDYRNGQDDIGDTQQTAINSSANKLVAANTAVATSDAISHEALQAFIKKYATCDTDVYKDPAVVTAQTDSANALYKTVTLFDTNYYSLDVANQSDLDNKITSYLNAINDENNIVTYNVTVPSGVSVVVRGATQTPVSGNTYNLICGENATFVNTGKADTAWYMEYTSNNAQRGNQYQAYGESFTTKIVGNMTVTAESYDTGKNCVSIVREYDKAGAGKAIDRVSFIADGDYTLPTPTKIANYNFIGYYINDVKIDTATIAINGDTNIVAKYQYAESDLTVKVNGTAKTYAYNESVSVRASGAYAWVEKTIGSETWRPFYIGSAVTFRATESTELKSVTQDEFNAMFTAEAFAPILRQNGVLVDADNRAVFHAQRIDYLPAGAQVVEFGILMNTASSTDFDLGNDKGVGQRNEKTVRLKSTQSLDKVQFNIFVKNAGNKAFTYKSYMIYKLADGTVETVYSDVFTKA